MSFRGLVFLFLFLTTFVPMTGCGSKTSGEAAGTGSDKPPELTPEQVKGEQALSKQQK